MGNPKRRSDETLTRIRATVERSAPSRARPKMSRKKEERLEAVDRASAACYASMENLGAKIEKLTRSIAEGVEDDERDGEG